MKRKASPDRDRQSRWPIWCCKSRAHYGSAGSVVESLGVSEESAQMMVTGSTNAYPTMETAERAASAEVIGMATARSNAARESLAQSEADAVASLSPCEHHFILHKTTVALGEAAAASIKAQDAAAQASARYVKALAAADAHHARFRALRDAAAHECAAAAACARAHAGQQPRRFPNGLVGYDCDPKVGDIDRFSCGCSLEKERAAAAAVTFAASRTSTTRIPSPR